MNLSVDSHDQKSQMLVVDTFHGTRVCGEQTLFRHLSKHESEARDALSNALVLVGPLAPTLISFAAYAALNIGRAIHEELILGTVSTTVTKWGERGREIFRESKGASP
jgi:hypothetical protein